MPYDVTFWSKPHLSQTGKTTTRKETAAEAWMLVQQLEASDETVEIATDTGRSVGRGELQMLAEREAN